MMRIIKFILCLFTEGHYPTSEDIAEESRERAREHAIRRAVK